MALALLFALFVIFLGLRRLLRFLRHRSPQPPFPAPVLASPAALPPSLWKYDVFLSFRGKDTRKRFISHLYDALEAQGINVFYDDDGLQRGDYIWSGLTKASDNSRYAIIVLSENYAESRWCLEELLHITRCVESKGLVLIPIFYGVEPSDVKKRSGIFARAFEEHEGKYGQETVGRWRKALAQVGNISGWDSKNWNEESKLIEKVVQDLLDKLSRDSDKELAQDLSDGLFSLSSSDRDEWVGMSSHLSNIEPLLCIDSKDVRMVGIWGMGGVGKTTIAGFVCKRLSSEFDASCLLENVKGEFGKHGPSKLRKRILSQIFRKKDQNTWDNDLGLMKRRLRGKKVLLVLDDVDNIEQLQQLAGSSEWFGQGSRIIITTRDKRVLDQHDLQYTYELKPLRTTQALQLFSKHAFKQTRPPEEFQELSIDVVKQLGGLPLALRVIGASLYRRDITHWENKLLKLKNSLDISISKALRESYEALDSQEKMTFLYAACCFNGEYMSRVREVLDLFVVYSGGNSLSSKHTIDVLMEKCLVSVLYKERLWVHDLLQDLARDIVCEGKEVKPWKRIMLWNFEDIDNVFHESMGAEAIETEAMFLNMADEEELRINPAIFERMFNLKLLKIYNNCSIGGSKTCILSGLENLPELRYLHWEAYPQKSLPSKFCTTHLVALHLPNSSVETLWSGTQNLGNLRRMNLNRCRRLIEIPDLSKAINLESLRLCDCESLVELPSSLAHLNKLEELSARGCVKLKNLPDNINLESLKVLNLDRCSSLEDFPFVSENIEELGLSKTAIEEVPPSIERLTQLETLRMSGCQRLKKLPDSIRNLGSLRYLWLANCPCITLFPEVGDQIKSLYLNGTAIEEVPSTIGDKNHLLLLNMSGCERLKNLPQTLRNLVNLKFLLLRGCTNITQRPQTAGEMRRLDLYGTSIEECRSLSEEEALEMHNRDMASAKKFVARYIRRYKKHRVSMN